MNQNQHPPINSILPYFPVDHSLNFNQNKNNKNTHSLISTRKSSIDSMELKGKFKTEMCKYYLLEIECPFLDLCCFAHGEEQLRSKEVLPTKYKTKVCSKFNLEGYCPYGPRCQFIHSQGNHIINYQKIVQKIRNDSELFFEFFNEQGKKKPRRLSFFQEIEEVKDYEEKDEEQCYFPNSATDVLAVRTRHNSI